MHQFRSTADQRHRYCRSFIEINAEESGTFLKTIVEDFLNQSRERQRRFKIKRFRGLIVIKLTKDDAATLDLGAEQHHVLIAGIVTGDFSRQFMTNHRNRIQRRAQSVRGCRRQRAKRRCLLLCGQSKTRL